MKIVIIVVLCIISTLSNAITNGAAVTASDASIIFNKQSDMTSKDINTHFQNSNSVIGVMTCDATYTNITEMKAYDIDGCRTTNGPISIKKFFERHRKKKSYEIIQIIYTDYRNVFHIYYGKKQSLFGS
ncbi:MAG TPA: hypothetical protein VHZ76_03310 [Gammaproteobacteria bacterium]|jgi:hypothetical protein|nr:hypothetical protein [Gammaproteobacteria bacterium]